MFARGEILQTIDMNQDFSYIEALKFRWFVEEFQYSKDNDFPRYSLIGCNESIYTHPVSLIGRLMAYQDSSFNSIVKRVLNYLNSLSHYGHPDLEEGIWVRYHIGMSKASVSINLSEDVFFGFDSALRNGPITYVEYIQYYKGREVNLLSTTIFENKLSRGCALALGSSDVYRVSEKLPSQRAISILFGSLGHYFYTLLFDWTIELFVWILIVMSVSGINSERIGILGSVYAIPWLFHLGYAFGFPLLLQLIYTQGIMVGLFKWTKNLFLGVFYYLFQQRTKAYGFHVGLSGGSGNYAGTGRGFGLSNTTLLAMFQSYAHSHYYPALQLLLLLLIYLCLFTEESFFSTMLKTYAIILAIGSWILTPPLFNPSLNANLSSIQQKRAELREVWEWIQADFYSNRASKTINTNSWQVWCWHGKLGQLLQKIIRYRTSSDTKFKLMLNPTFAGIADLFLSLLLSIPYLFLAGALLYTKRMLILPLMFYIVLVVIVSLITPSPRLHLFLLVILLLFYYSFVQFFTLIRNPYQLTLQNNNFLISFSQFGDVFVLLLSFLIMAIFTTEIAMKSFDIYLLRKLNSNPMLILHMKRNRPLIYIYAMEGKLGRFYQFVHRHLVPLSIAGVHYAVSRACEYFHKTHNKLLYGVQREKAMKLRKMQ